MKFSVVTVCLNSVQTIEKTIKSVISQENVDLEYIVVDGGSVDGTLELIKKYEHKITKWLSQPDQGIYDAMNKGVDMATGEIISFLNSNDWYEEGIFPLLEDTFTQKKCDIVAAGQAMIENNEIVGYSPRKRKDSDLYFDMIYSHPALFAKRDLFLEHGGFNLQYKVCADYDWILKVYEQGAQIESIDFITTNFTLGGLSSGKECMEERRQISIRYLPKQLKETGINRIEKLYQKGIEVFMFQSAVKKMKEEVAEREKVKRLLHEKFQWSESCNLFGAGLRAKECFDILDALDMRVEHIYDNSEVRQGTEYLGITVEKPENSSDGNTWIIASTIYEEEIEQQIQEMGIKKYIKISDIIKIIADFA